MLHVSLLRLAIAAACVTIAIGNPAPAQMQYPLSVAIGPDDTLLVADRNLPGLWRIQGNQTTKYFHASKRFRTPLNAVRCVATDNMGAVLAGDSSTRDIFRFDESAKPVALTDGGIGIPMDIVVDAQGALLVSDLELHRICRVPAEGGKPEVLAEVPAPRGVCLDEEGKLWVASHGENHVVKVASDGQVEVVVKGRPFQFHHDIALGPDGTAYVSDGYEKAIWRISPGGKPEKWVSGEPLVNPVGLVWQNDMLIIADPRANAIFQVGADGKPQAMPLEFPK